MRFLVSVIVIIAALTSSAWACTPNDKFRVIGILASHPNSQLIGNDTVSSQIVYQNREFAGHVGDYFVLKDGLNMFKIYAPHAAVVDIEVSYVLDSANCAQKSLMKFKPHDSQPCALPKNEPYKLSQWSGYDTQAHPNFALVIGSLEFKSRPFPNCSSIPSSLGDIKYDNLILEITSNVESAEVSVEGKSAGTLNLTEAISIPYANHLDDLSIVLKKPGHANCTILIQSPSDNHSAKCDLIPL